MSSSTPSLMVLGIAIRSSKTNLLKPALLFFSTRSLASFKDASNNIVRSFLPKTILIVSVRRWFFTSSRVLVKGVVSVVEMLLVP